MSFYAGKILRIFLLLVSVFYCCASYSAIARYSICYGGHKVGTVTTWPDELSFFQKFNLKVAKEVRNGIVEQFSANGDRLPRLLKYIACRDQLRVDLSFYSLEVESRKVWDENGSSNYSVAPLNCSAHLKVMLSFEKKENGIRLLELFSYKWGRESTCAREKI